MSAVAIDEEMNHVFEGSTEEMMRWLKAGSPDIMKLYLIRDTLGRILTVTEFLELNA